MTAFTHTQYLRVADWLADLAYKPGTSFEAVYEDELGVIKVYINALLFDSTRPLNTRVLRGQSVNIALPADLQPADSSGLEMYAFSTYAVGPDLVGGPLVRIGKSSVLPFWMVVPVDDGAVNHRADLAEARSAFLRWMREQLHELEAHESDEWFRDRSTGKVFYDPHAGV